MQDAARFLADSPDRLALLTRLRTGAAGPAALAADLDCARRSIQRNLAAFVDRGWVERSDDGYQLTTTGEYVATTHETYLDQLERIDRFDPLLRQLDPEHAPPLALLEDADLVVTTPEHPQAPVQAYVDHLTQFDADTVRMCSPVLSRSFHDAHASLAMRGAHTTLVLPEATAQKARDLNPREFETILRIGPLDLYAHPDPIPVGLTIGENQLLVAAYDEDGHLEACLTTTNPELVAWAEARFEHYRDHATPIEPGGGPPFGLGPQ